MGYTDMNEASLPLNGLRILDLCEGTGDLCGRYLADLGAEVILVEPPGGSAAREQQPLIDGASAWFATHNANKNSVVLDAGQAADRDSFLGLAAAADLVIHDRSPAALEWVDHLAAVGKPELITLAISDFGDSGPYTDYLATNATQMAMTGGLARSGIKGREPLLPPGQLAYESSAIQAAWVALVAYWQRLHTGRGGEMDFSIFEATCQILDPAMGVTGSAAAGKSATQLAPRGRPPEGKGYPFFHCADGYVRICVLNPRQWDAMSAWLGDDHPFTDPSYAKMAVRWKEIREINAHIQDLFADQKADDLVVEGQRRGVPIAAVASPQHVLHDEHFQIRGAFADLELAPGRTGQSPSGYLEVNGERMGIRSPAPALGAGSSSFSDRAAASSAPGNDPSIRRPLAGIRILDLGVIVAGAELGRLFADQGAHVIKVESTTYPDGLRQSWDGSAMTESVAQGCRGKQSLGLNLRSEEGKRVFKELVAKSDIVMSNFKPGTMESLGFGYDELKAINPAIIVSDSSALGSSGPMSKTMGYGPLVRASSGLTGLWRYPDDERSFADALTIFPDHLAARVSATAILALLVQRELTGEGGTVSLSQAETILMSLSTELYAESLNPGFLRARGNVGQFDAPANIFPCAGDDEWCAIEVCNNEQWKSLCLAIGQQAMSEDPRYQSAADRLQHREEIEKAVTAWTQTLAPKAVTEQLQRAGVPAGFMQRVHELAEDPQLQARNFFRTNHQPGLPEPVLTENAPVGRSHLPLPEINPAPRVAEHTREILRSVLNMADEEIEALVASGDLEALDYD